MKKALRKGVEYIQVLWDLEYSRNSISRKWEGDLGT